MLFKLALQNIRKSKGYFVAYTFTIAAFFIIVYQLSHIETEIQGYLNLGLSLSEIDLGDTFTSLKYFMYAVVIFFALYISRFFIKRRSNEVALLKTLGLNRINIWYMFLIENSIVVVCGTILGLIGGILSSRLFSIIALQLIGFEVENVQFSFLMSGLIDGLILMLFVYIVISIVPILTIAKSSIIELFSSSIKNKTFKRKPWISLILFVVFSATLLCQAFFVIPNDEFISTETALLYFVNACLVAIFLYRGLLIFYFMKYQEKHKGINSPIRLLSFNHLASDMPALYKMMSFITVISAVIAVCVVVVFGMLNQVNQVSSYIYEDEERSKIQYVSSDKDSILTMNNNLAKLNENYQTMEVVSIGEIDFKRNDDTYEVIINRKNLLIVKESDFKKYLEANNEKFIPLNENEIYSNVVGNCQDTANKTYCDFLEEKGIINTREAYALTTMLTANLGEWYLEAPVKNASQEDIKAIAEYNKFIVPNIIVLPDDNEIFNGENVIYYTTSLNGIKQNEIFDYFNVLFNQANQSKVNVAFTNDVITSHIVRVITIGLFQVVFLMIAIVTLISLMMAIFFKTLENLEKGVYEYIIAKQVGLSNRQIKISIFIEAFMAQVLPFVLGGIVSMLLLQQFIGDRLEGESIRIDTLTSLTEPATLAILGTVLSMLIILLIILFYIINKKINESKVIKIV